MSIQTSTQPQPSPFLITIWEASRLIGMRRGTAKKRLEEGKFPIPFIKIGRGNMCHIDDVEAYATAAKITAAKRHPIAAAALQQTRTTDIEPPRRGPGRPRK